MVNSQQVFDVEIRVENSYCFILGVNENYSYKIYKDLDEILSFDIPGVHFARNLPYHLRRKKLFTLDKELQLMTFPTGLLHLVVDYLTKARLSYGVQDVRQAPKSFKTFFFQDPSVAPPLRYYQEEIVEACLREHRGVVESATGTGKTRIIMEVAKRLSLPTLIVVTSTAILEQTADLFEKAFSSRMIGVIGNGSTELNKSITIATYQSLEKLPNSFWNRINVIMIDEFHHSGCETIQELNRNQFQKIYYRFGFTGTNFRNGGDDLALQGVLSNVIYEYPATKAIAEGYLCKPSFIFHTFHHVNKGYSSWQKECKEMIVLNNTYNSVVASITLGMVERGFSTLVFVNEIEQGRALEKLLPEAVFVNGLQKGSFNQDTLEDFNSGKVKCLIGTSVIGEGVDTIRASCAIMAGWGKARSDVIQKVGRLLRPLKGKKGAVLIDFIHNNTKYLIKHSRERADIYREYGSEIIYIQP